MAELSICNRNCMSWKARNIYCLVLGKACRPLPYLFSCPLSHIFPNSSITQTPELPSSLAQVNPHLGFPGGASGKEPTYQCRRCKRMQVWSLGREDSLEEGMATYSSILAWEIPWTEEPGGLQSIGLQSWSSLKQLKHAHMISIYFPFGAPCPSQVYLIPPH